MDVGQGGAIPANLAPQLSVVAPVWNEAETLPLFYARCRNVLDALVERWELVLIDDGSADGSREVMETLSNSDPRVRALIFSRNFGHQIAITAGLDYARGDAVVVIDSDLQDPPEVMAALYEKWKSGFKVV